MLEPETAIVKKVQVQPETAPSPVEALQAHVEPLGPVADMDKPPTMVEQARRVFVVVDQQPHGVQTLRKADPPLKLKPRQV